MFCAFQNSNYYKTKFDAPKKLKEKKLTSGIRKFLERQKIEEEEKIREAHEKKMELIARRDPKEQRKIDKTLKVIKSSKKFYTGDRELDENTEITLEKSIGDDDDYGFENKSSEAIYLKLMEQYKKMPTEDKFEKFMNPKKSKSSANNNQVAANDDDENGDEYHIKTGHRQRVSKIKSEGNSQPAVSKKSQPAQPSTSSSKSIYPKVTSSTSVSIIKHDNVKINQPVEKPKPKIRAAPIVNFEQLLKLAEQKQHEDIVVDVPSKKKEPERLLTMKEKREMEELEAARKGKHKGNGTIPKIPKLGAIPRLNDPSKQDRNNNSDKTPQKLPSNDKRLEKSDSKVPFRSDGKSSKSSASPPSTGSKLRDALVKRDERSSNSSPISSKVQSKSQVPQSSKPQLNGNGMKSKESTSKPIVASSSKMPPPMKSGSSSTMNGNKSNLAVRDPMKTSKEPQKSRDFPPKDLMRAREFPPRDLIRAREFPPKDVRRFKEPPRGMRMPQKMPVKRNILLYLIYQFLLGDTCLLFFLNFNGILSFEIV